MSDNLDIATTFFAASSSGDTDAMNALCAEDLVVRQNGGAEMPFAAVARLAKAIRRVAPDFRYENAIRGDTGNGFVEEHDVAGTLPDGTTFRMAVCVVATVLNGKITTMHEYLDTAEAKPLMEALARRAN